MLVILSFLMIVWAEASTPAYSRMYLRGLKRLENERIQSEQIARGITYIEDSVFTAAKQGLVSFTTEPFYGCDQYTQPSEISPAGVDKVVCEHIVHGIRSLVSQRFPDSEITYDPVTKRYTLSWD
jgi:hypothetical protein